MHIKPNQHPDFIWTWKSNKRKGKVSLWLPYLQSIEKLPKGKGDRYRFVFNGGEVTAHLKEIEFLMIYGRSGSLPIEFLVLENFDKGSSRFNEDSKSATNTYHTKCFSLYRPKSMVFCSSTNSTGTAFCA